MGVKLIPVELRQPALQAQWTPVLEAGSRCAAFDQASPMTGRDKLLTEQGQEDWPNAPFA